MNKRTIVTTSWDDGHKLDLELARLLRKYNIRGTFYICPRNREFKKGDLLSNGEIIRLSKDFEIGAHTMTHPRLTQVTEKRAFQEIFDSKIFLENLMKKEVKCFCYPGGKYNSKIRELMTRAHLCGARTTERFEFDSPEHLLLCETTLETHRNSLLTFPLDSLKTLRFSRYSPIEFFKNLNWEYLAIQTFDYVNKNQGIYHLWGHSWVIDKCHDWGKLEHVLCYISNRDNVRYLTNHEMIQAERR